MAPGTFGRSPIPASRFSRDQSRDRSAQQKRSDHCLLRRRRSLASRRQGHERNGLSKCLVHGRRLCRLEKRRLQMGAGFSVYARAIDPVQPALPSSRSRRGWPGEITPSQSFDDRRRRTGLPFRVLFSRRRSRNHRNHRQRRCRYLQLAAANPSRQ